MVTVPRLVLIGPPGSGKTTVGRLVAERWGAAFLDTDEAVERRAGRPIAQIFVDDGETHFRQLEAEEVLAALQRHDGVLALGGGAPLQDAVAQALAGHQVVFLDVGVRDAARRIGLDGTRPLLAINPRATWTRLMEQRRPTYERLAVGRVDTAGRPEQDVVEDVLRIIEERT